MSFIAWVKGQFSKKSLSNQVTNLSMRYGDQTAVRVLVQTIPYVGGPLDTLVSNGGQRIKMERVEHLLAALDEQMRALQARPNIADLATSEGFYDLVYFSLEQATKTRSEEKRRKFASIIRRQVVENLNWDEAESAAHLLAELSEFELHVLAAICRAPVCGAPFDGLAIVEVDSYVAAGRVVTDTFRPLDLTALYPNVVPAAIRMTCASLIAKGLIEDEGAQRMGGSNLKYVEATDSAEWFFTWID